MKYLFFDCEFASCKGGSEKICEFGYTMVDESFKILYKGNIIINPNIKASDWDYFALKKILTRKKEVYENMLFFPAYHKKIEALILNADVILGHTIEADVHALNCELQRYNLPALNFEFYDIKEMYKAYNASKRDVSVETMLVELGISGDENKHDAEADAYNTMLELKTILEKLEMSVQDLIELCPSAKDKTENFVMDSRERAKQRKEERLARIVSGDYSDGTNDMLHLKRKGNKKMFLRFLDNVQPTKEGSGIFKGKKITISINYEGRHFKEMMNLLQIITNEGGTYVLKGSLSDIYVKYDTFREDGTPYRCTRLEYVLKANEEGANIEIITFDEFLKRLNLTNEELENMPLPPLDCLLREDAIIKDRKLKNNG